MVTPEEMRLFALDCLRCSEETDNASHRELMFRVARTWTTTASAVDRRGHTAESVLPDLRTKLD